MPVFQNFPMLRPGEFVQVRTHILEGTILEEAHAFFAVVTMNTPPLPRQCEVGSLYLFIYICYTEEKKD
jgi:hypothetical protein